MLTACSPRCPYSSDAGPAVGHRVLMSVSERSGTEPECRWVEKVAVGRRGFAVPDLSAAVGIGLRAGVRECVGTYPVRV